MQSDAYTQAKRLRRTLSNPWLAVALDRVAATYRGLEYRHAFVATVWEYAHDDDGPKDCPSCGQPTFWYRASVGARVCAHCHHVQTREA